MPRTNRLTMQKFRQFLTLFLFFVLALPLAAAPQKVTWQAQLQPSDIRAGEGAQIVLTARLEKGWHLYSTTQPSGGSLPTSIELVPNKALKAVGKVVQPAPLKKPNEVFNITDELYENAVAFGVPVKVNSGITGAEKAKLRVRFMVCTDKTCLPPATVEVPVSFEVGAGEPRAENAAPITEIPQQPAGAINGEGAAPIVAPTTAPGSASDDGNIARRIQTAQSGGIVPFLVLAFSMGFLALLTPCVFPMIPITVSFFAKQQENEGGRGLSGPMAYCAGIVATFTAIGVFVTLIFGASGVQAIAANPWVNLAMALVFVALALNLFGVYEIMVPSWIMEKVQPGATPGKTGKSSLIAPILMGLAFSLTSFTCTVPFVGTLLVATAQGDWLWPLLGMACFSTAFAAPFFLLALFPQWLAKLPRAGSWLVSVKAFMGFMELAAALKFLSQADLVWKAGILTRPVFLSLWSTIFLVAGFYLLRWLRLPKESDNNVPGPFRRTLGVATVTVGAWMMWATGGASTGLLDSYLPPRAYGQPKSAIHSAWIVDDYERAIAQSKAQNKPLLLNFTGYTCTNCRLMEERIFPQESVAAELKKFVLAELFTDGLDEKSKFNAKLQQEKFGTVALPIYIILSPDGKELARFEGFDPNPQVFVNFLQRGQTRLAQNE
jgi:thiol:disulfide interchange protein